MADILILTPASLLNAIHIRSRFVCHFVTHSNMVQIRSRYEFHTDTSFRIPFQYSPDTVQITMSFCHSFKIQSRYDPDTNVILTLIQYISQIRVRYNSFINIILFLIQDLFWFSLNLSTVYPDTFQMNISGSDKSL